MSSMGHSLLVEYKDGSLQWVKNSSEEEVMRNPEVARIKSQSYGSIKMESRRWKEGKTQFQVKFIDDPSF
jgi:hypothetical protein